MQIPVSVSGVGSWKWIRTDGARVSGRTDGSVGLPKAVAGLGALCPDTCGQQAGPPTRSLQGHRAALLRVPRSPSKLGLVTQACDIDGCCPLSSCIWSLQGRVPVHDCLCSLSTQPPALSLSQGGGGHTSAHSRASGHTSSGKTQPWPPPSQVWECQAWESAQRSASPLEPWARLAFN